MSKGFIPMLITCVGAIIVYYYWSIVLGLNDNAGMALGIAMAVILSALFAKSKKKKGK
jgi:uncharacterized membrane protein (DUF106 family)